MSLRDLMVSIDFDINTGALDDVNSQTDDVTSSFVDVGDTGEGAFNEVTDSVEGTASEINNLEDESQGFFSTLSDNWGKITVGAGAAGGAIELLGRESKEFTEITDRSAKAIGVSSSEYRDLALDITNVTFPMEDVLALMETGRQQGLESGEELQRYASFWDTVGDATGLAGPALGEASAGLRAVGIAAGEEEQALAAFGYVTESTTGDVSEFLRFLERTGPQLNDLGMNVDDAAGMLGILEHEFGMSGRIARTEFRKAVNEADGDLDQMLDTLGISQEMFDSYSDAVAGSSDVIQDNADIHEQSYTAMERLGQWASEVTYQFGPLIDAATMFVPILLALGPIIGIIGKIVPLVKGLGGAFALVSNPIGWIILGIGLIVGAVILMYNKFEWFREGVHAIWDWIVESTAVVFDFLLEIITTVWDFILEMTDLFWQGLLQIWETHGEFIMSIVDFLMTTISENIQSGMAFIEGVFNAVWPVISAIVEVAWGLIKVIVETGIDLVLGIIDVAMSLLQGDWEGAWNKIKEIGETIWQNIVGFFEEFDLYQIGADILQGLIDGIGSMAGAVWGKVTEIASGIGDKFKSALSIFSPSRDFMDYGVDTMLGYNIGFDDEANNVLDTVGDVGMRIGDEFNPQISGTGNGGGGAKTENHYTFEINVRGGDGDRNTARRIRDEIENYLQMIKAREV